MLLNGGEWANNVIHAVHNLTSHAKNTTTLLLHWFFTFFSQDKTGKLGAY